MAVKITNIVKLESTIGSRFEESFREAVLFAKSNNCKVHFYHNLGVHLIDEDGNFAKLRSNDSTSRN
jgi:hypothetical protein